MAMAMATTVAGGARILSPFSTVSRSSIAASSSSRVAHLCSSFKGLSVQKWQKSSSGHGGDITDLSGIASSSSVSSGTTTTRKLVFTFAKIKTHKLEITAMVSQSCVHEWDGGAGCSQAIQGDRFWEDHAETGTQAASVEQEEQQQKEASVENDSSGQKRL